MWERVSSATLRLLEKGELNTGTPNPSAAGRSVWSVPMQKHPTAFSRRAAVSTAEVSRDFDRTPFR